MNLRASLIAVLLPTALQVGAVAAHERTETSESEAVGHFERASGNSVWDVTIHDGEVDFYLKESDLDRDFVVLKSTKQEESWQLIRWSREADSVVLRSSKSVGIVLRGNPTKDVLNSPDWIRDSTIVHRFPSESDSSSRYRVRVTGLFKERFPQGWGMEAGTSAPASANFLEPKIFPRNVVIAKAASLPPSGVARGKSEGSRWNFVRLPDQKMQTRTSYGMHPFKQIAFSGERYAQEPQAFVKRWRLERVGIEGELDSPRTPITVYLDPNTPSQWRPWVKAGIESWQRAFEEIGYRAAIQVGDPDGVVGWDYDDVRNSVVCWSLPGRPNLCGWDVFDPRTGEILQNQVHSTSNAVRAFLAKYVVSMAASDPRVLETPLSSSFLGSFFKRVASHEVGHLLGMGDGTFGTYSYDTSQLRDPKWNMLNSFSPSIMNYSRFNYIPQPEDGVPPDLLMPDVGPSDVFWIRWGYSAPGFEGELKKQWESNGLYRYRRRIGDMVVGPYDVLDMPGVADPIEGAVLGLRNLERSVGLLSGREIVVDDPDVQRLVDAESLQKAVIEQWKIVNTPVVSLIGGRLLDPSLNSSGEPLGDMAQGVGYVDKETQSRAIRFLCESFFASPPSYLVEGPLFDRSGLSRSEVESDIREAKSEVFSLLVNRPRYEVLHEIDGRVGSESSDYGAYDLLHGMKSCIVR